MLVVLDYGGGNLGSLLAALERRREEFMVSDTAKDARASSALILPGDGAFGATMDALHARALIEPVRDHIAQGKPFLGICVGMQILFEGSDEFGGSEGLGVFKGRIERFTRAPRVPHMGWNRLEPLSDHSLVSRLGEEPYAYFLHSYRAPVGPDTVAAATHGERFCAVAARGTLAGTQFHPEKSRTAGATILDNFLSLARKANT